MKLLLPVGALGADACPCDAVCVPAFAVVDLSDASARQTLEKLRTLALSTITSIGMIDDQYPDGAEIALNDMFGATFYAEKDEGTISAIQNALDNDEAEAELKRGDLPEAVRLWVDGDSCVILPDELKLPGQTEGSSDTRGDFLDSAMCRLFVGEHGFNFEYVHLWDAINVVTPTVPWAVLDNPVD